MKASEVPGPWGQQWVWCFPPSLLFHTHMTSAPFVKLFIIAKRTNGRWSKIKNIDFLSGQQISCKGSSMHTECQNIFIIEVVSLILLDKLRNETQ